MQIGNAVALIFDRSIEGKSDPKGLHNAAAMAIVAFCRDEHPKLLNDARFASAFVRGRNDYAYRHDRIAERQQLSKADLARHIEAEPAAGRRLFTEPRPNPQIARLVDIAHELGLEITVARRRRRRGSRRYGPVAGR